MALVISVVSPRSSAPLASPVDENVSGKLSPATVKKVVDKLKRKRSRLKVTQTPKARPTRTDSSVEDKQRAITPKHEPGHTPAQLPSKRRGGRFSFSTKAPRFDVDDEDSSSDDDDEEEEDDEQDKMSDNLPQAPPHSPTMRKHNEWARENYWLRHWRNMIGKDPGTRTAADISMLHQWLVGMKLPFFRRLPDTIVRALCEQIELIVVPKGQCIIKNKHKTKEQTPVAHTNPKTSSRPMSAMRAHQHALSQHSQTVPDTPQSSQMGQPSPVKREPARTSAQASLMLAAAALSTPTGHGPSMSLGTASPFSRGSSRVSSAASDRSSILRDRAGRAERGRAARELAALEMDLQVDDAFLIPLSGTVTGLTVSFPDQEESSDEEDGAEEERKEKEKKEGDETKEEQETSESHGNSNVSAEPNNESAQQEDQTEAGESGGTQGTAKSAPPKKKAPPVFTPCEFGRGQGFGRAPATAFVADTVDMAYRQVAEATSAAACEILVVPLGHLTNAFEQLLTHKLSFLRATSLCKRWPKNHVQRFALAMTDRTVPAGSYLYRQHEEATAVYLITKGECIVQTAQSEDPRAQEQSEWSELQPRSATYKRKVLELPQNALKQRIESRSKVHGVDDDEIEEEPTQYTELHEHDCFRSRIKRGQTQYYSLACDRPGQELFIQAKLHWVSTAKVKSTAKERSRVKALQKSSKSAKKRRSSHDVDADTIIASGLSDKQGEEEDFAFDLVVSSKHPEPSLDKKQHEWKGLSGLRTRDAREISIMLPVETVAMYGRRSYYLAVVGHRDCEYDIIVRVRSPALVQSASTKQESLAVLGAGEIVGVGEVLDNVKRIVSLQARTNLSVLEIPRKRFMQCMAPHGSSLKQLTGLVRQRLQFWKEQLQRQRWTQKLLDHLKGKQQADAFVGAGESNMANNSQVYRAHTSAYRRRPHTAASVKLIQQFEKLIGQSSAREPEAVTIRTVAASVTVPLHYRTTSDINQPPRTLPPLIEQQITPQPLRIEDSLPTGVGDDTSFFLTAVVDDSNETGGSGAFATSPTASSSPLQRQHDMKKTSHSSSAPVLPSRPSRSSAGSVVAGDYTSAAARSQTQVRSAATPATALQNEPQGHFESLATRNSRKYSLHKRGSRYLPSSSAIRSLYARKAETPNLQTEARKRQVQSILRTLSNTLRQSVVKDQDQSEPTAAFSAPDLATDAESIPTHEYSKGLDLEAQREAFARAQARKRNKQMGSTQPWDWHVIFTPELLTEDAREHVDVERTRATRSKKKHVDAAVDYASTPLGSGLRAVADTIAARGGRGQNKRSRRVIGTGAMTRAKQASVLEDRCLGGMGEHQSTGGGFRPGLTRDCTAQIYELSRETRRAYIKVEQGRRAQEQDKRGVEQEGGLFDVHQEDDDVRLDEDEEERIRASSKAQWAEEASDDEEAMEELDAAKRSDLQSRQVHTSQARFDWNPNAVDARRQPSQRPESSSSRLHKGATTARHRSQHELDRETQVYTPLLTQSMPLMPAYNTPSDEVLLASMSQVNGESGSAITNTNANAYTDTDSHSMRVKEATANPDSRTEQTETQLRSRRPQSVVKLLRHRALEVSLVRNHVKAAGRTRGSLFRSSLAPRPSALHREEQRRKSASMRHSESVPALGASRSRSVDRTMLVHRLDTSPGAKRRTKEERDRQRLQTQQKKEQVAQTASIRRSRGTIKPFKKAPKRSSNTEQKSSLVTSTTADVEAALQALLADQRSVVATQGIA